MARRSPQLAAIIQNKMNHLMERRGGHLHGIQNDGFVALPQSVRCPDSVPGPQLLNRDCPVRRIDQRVPCQADGAFSET
jgi:hypothetical protein